MAVWALKGFGIRCIVAKGFGSIFYANCVQNSVLPVVADPAFVDEIAIRINADPLFEIEVDLEKRSIVLPDGTSQAFIIDDAERETLLEGLDAIDRSLKRQNDVSLFRQRDRAARPWIYEIE
jgi:3-isopropylmalate/(R)-2-methylmalate dehydratase small subunit